LNNIFKKKRYLFLDVARGLAIVEMIHGHCLHALLALPARAGGFYKIWIDVRQYTAPLFLFIAGFAFAIATLSRLDDYTHLSPRLFRRISRIFFIIIIGYILHLPFFSLQKTLTAIGSPAWDAFLNVDILQCIGVSLLCLQLIFSLRLHDRLRTLLIATLMAVTVIVTPYLESAQWVQALPLVLKHYLVQSYFPIFPFSSYLLYGFLCGKLFVKKEHDWLKPAFMICALALLLSLTCRFFVNTSVYQGFMFKGGVLLFLTIILSTGEKIWRCLPSLILVFGQESLVIYVLHLFVIYGSVFNKGLVHINHNELSFGEVYSMVGILIVLMSALANIWHFLKKKYPTVAFSFRYALYISFIIRFVTRPY
jgi:uncharacterized membrane protein